MRRTRRTMFHSAVSAAPALFAPWPAGRRDVVPKLQMSDVKGQIYGIF
jgi:hypothetical protein